jgi:hypothetical protein
MSQCTPTPHNNKKNYIDLKNEEIIEKQFKLLPYYILQW